MQNLAFKPTTKIVAGLFVRKAIFVVTFYLYFTEKRHCGKFGNISIVSQRRHCTVFVKITIIMVNVIIFMALATAIFLLTNTDERVVVWREGGNLYLQIRQLTALQTATFTFYAFVQS